MTLIDETRALITASRQGQPIGPRMSTCARAVGPATAEQRNQALALLAPEFEQGMPSHLALWAGSLVEHGADASLVAQPFATAIGSILAEAAAAVPPLPAGAEPNLEALSAKHPDLVRALQLIEAFWRPFIAVLGASQRCRGACKGSLAAAQRLAPLSHGGLWLAKMLEVLDDEKLLVIAPLERRGFAVTFSAVAGNYELFTRLMDVLHGDPSQGWLEGSRPSAQAMAALGKAASDGSPPMVSGSWNHYGWRALPQIAKEGREAQVDLAHWIYGEGSPTEIPLFEGTRVLVLGPPLFNGAELVRHWPAGRTFQTLGGSVAVQQQLAPEAVASLMQRAAQAPHS